MTKEFLAIPAGWKLVPVEPTPEMIRNGAVESYGPLLAGVVYQERVRRTWQAMLDAAPQPPVVEQPQGEQPYVAATIAFYEDAREPRLLSWNRLPVGQHWLYTHPQPKPKPLTAEQWTQKLGDRQLFTILEAIRFVEKEYGIEDAHGIGGEA